VAERDHREPSRLSGIARLGFRPTPKAGRTQVMVDSYTRLLRCPERDDPYHRPLLREPTISGTVAHR
jgi:hypothetical protein